MKAVDLKDSDDCLFVIVVRNPYDWLRSFHLKPYEAAPHIRLADFKTFVSIEWQVQTDYLPGDGQYDEIDNLNPWTGRPFRNVIELRKYKTENYLSLSDLAQNYVFVRYEDVRDDPEGFIEFLASRYNLTRSNQLIPVTSYNGTGAPYTPSRYFPIPKNILDFINSEIDWELEHRLGYAASDYYP